MDQTKLCSISWQAACLYILRNAAAAHSGVGALVMDTSASAVLRTQSPQSEEFLEQPSG